jgi:hypothetical protein
MLVVDRADAGAKVFCAFDFAGLGFEAARTQARAGFTAERTGGGSSSVGIGGFENECARLVSFRRDDFASESAHQRRAALAFFQAEDPPEHNRDFIRRVLRMREHRDFAPDFCAPFTHALCARIKRAGQAAILCGDLDERWDRPLFARSRGS